MKKRRGMQDKVVNIIFAVLLVVIGIMMIYPLWYVIIASISEPMAVASGKVLFWPMNFTLDGYRKMFEYTEIWLGYRNSLFYLFFGSFISLAVIIPAGYALSRKQLQGRRGLNFLFTISMYFSGGLIPTYLLHRSIGWINTIWVLIIPAALNVYNLFLVRSFFESSIPNALYESAKLDGATDYGFLFRIAIPLSKAIIAVIFLFSALQWWNEYMRFVIYIDNPKLQSLQVIIRQITQELSEFETQMLSQSEIQNIQRNKELLKFSVVVIAALPFAIIYPFVQKYFNQGVMVGAVKE